MSKKKSRGNGEGSIIKRVINGCDYWVGEYTLGYDNGKRKYKTLYGKTRQEVKDKLNKLIIDLGTGKYVDKSNITMYEIGKQFIDNEYNLNHIIGNTYITKLHNLEQLNKHYIAQKQIQDITGYDIKDFYKYLANNYSDSIIGKVCGLSNTIFKLAMKRNIVKYNFFDDILEYKRPKALKKAKAIKAFTLTEQKQIVDVIMNKEKKVLYKIQFLLSMYCGLRMGEINALYWDDIDLDNNCIHISRTLTRDTTGKTIMGKTTKTYNSTRSVYFNNDIKIILQDYITKNYNSNNRLVFPNPKNKLTYISTAQVNSSFKRLCKKYNIATGWDVNQHQLRHTYATRCIEAGMNPKVLQKILGHKKIDTTLDTYCDVFDAYEKKHNDITLEYLKENNLMIFNNY